MLVAVLDATQDDPRVSLHHPCLPPSGAGLPHVLHLHDPDPVPGEIPGGFQPPSQGNLLSDFLVKRTKIIWMK